MGLLDLINRYLYEDRSSRNVEIATVISKFNEELRFHYYFPIKKDINLLNMIDEYYVSDKDKSSITQQLSRLIKDRDITCYENLYYTNAPFVIKRIANINDSGNECFGKHYINIIADSIFDNNYKESDINQLGLLSKTSFSRSYNFIRSKLVLIGNINNRLPNKGEIEEPIFGSDIQDGLDRVMNTWYHSDNKYIQVFISPKGIKIETPLTATSDAIDELFREYYTIGGLPDLRVPSSNDEMDALYINIDLLKVATTNGYLSKKLKTLAVHLSRCTRAPDENGNTIDIEYAIGMEAIVKIVSNNNEIINKLRYLLTKKSTRNKLYIRRKPLRMKRDV